MPDPSPYIPGSPGAASRLPLKKLIAFIHQKGIGGPVGPAHTSPKLVELREPEPVRIVYDDCIYVEISSPVSNDGGRYQHIDLPCL